MSRVPASRDSDLSIPFVLTEASLRKLDEALGRFGDKVTYYVKCADELLRELDLKKLLAYENAPKKAIRGITIEVATEGDILRTASVRLRQSAFLAPVNFSCQGPESEVEKLSDALESILAGMKPWYWLLAKYSAFFTSLVVAGVVLGLFLLGCLLCWFLAPSPAKAHNDNVPALMTLLFVSMGAMLALDWFKGKLFPRATFAIGQGASRYELLEKVRWGVVVAFLVSFAASVAVLVVQR